MKKNISQKVFQYTAIFEPDEIEGGYTVTIPVLPGCISEGDTFEKAVSNIKEAAELYLEIIKEKNYEIYSNKGIIIAPIEVSV
jgi:predicted RNase H-like HicB family nuclease